MWHLGIINKIVLVCGSIEWSLPLAFECLGYEDDITNSKGKSLLNAKSSQHIPMWKSDWGGI